MPSPVPLHQLDRRAAERDHLLLDAEPIEQQTVGLRDPYRRNDRVGQGVFLEQLGMIPQKQIHPVLRIPLRQLDLGHAQQLAELFQRRPGRG